MKRTITRLFDTRTQAEAAVRELEVMDIPHSHIAIIARHSGAAEDRSFAATDDDGRNDAAEGAGKGAATGGALGAGAGLLAGLGLLAIPGLGPVVAAGWLATTAVGALAGAAAGGAAGGILGALKDAGVPEDDANVYAEGVRRGAALVSVKAEEADIPRIEAALDGLRGIDAATRGDIYRQEGWTRFDPEASVTGLDSGAQGLNRQ